MFRWIIGLIILGCIDFYAFQAIKTIFNKRWIYVLYISISVSIIIAFVYFVGVQRKGVLEPPANYVLGIFLAFLLAKIILILFLFSEDLVRVFWGIYKKFKPNQSDNFLPSRRKFVSNVALGIAAIPFSSLLYGMIYGKYNYKVFKYELEFDELPEAFNGYTITQISDIHCGSLDNFEKIKYAVQLINKQQSDVIVFTGDLVNNKTSEINPWKNLFATLKAKDGVFSVMGNHDYGDYIKWESPQEKLKNLQNFHKAHKEMGWTLLLNQHQYLYRGSDKIALVGVENWGENGFKKAGDLDKASAGLTKDDFKIVLSHDPSHWKSIIKKHTKNFQLTLSGHTHGMQFGIEIPGWLKWSPIKYRYENWAGIYSYKNKYINVNRGLGFLAYPGRVGISPEITVLKLKKKTNTT